MMKTTIETTAVHTPRMMGMYVFLLKRLWENDPLLSSLILGESLSAGTAIGVGNRCARLKAITRGL